MHLIKNFKIWIAFFVGLYILFGFAILPNIALKKINEYTQNNIEQKISIDKLSFNPFTFNATIYNLSIKNKSNDQNLISILETSVNIELLSLLTNEINFDSIEIFHPQINAILQDDGTLNLAKIQPKNNTQSKDSQNSSLPYFSVDEFILENATIHFTDNTLETPFKTTISDFSYVFSDLSTQPNSLGSHTLSLKLDETTSLEVDGGIYLNPLLIYGNVDLKDFQSKLPLAYLKEKLNFDISNTNIDTNFGFVANLFDLKNPSIKIEGANLHIDHLTIFEKNTQNPLSKFKAFDIADLHFDLKSNKLSIGIVSFDELYANTVLKSNGTINLLETFVPNESKEKEVQSQSKPLDLLVHDIILKNASIDFIDEKNTFQTQVKDLDFKLEKLTLAQNDLFDFSLNLSTLENATIKNKGKLSLFPLSINSQFAINDLHLNKLSPYYDDYLNFQLQEAIFGSEGNLVFEAQKDQLLLQNTNSIIKNLKIAQKNSDESVISLKELQTNNLQLDLKEQAIALESVIFDTLFSSIEISKNKEINLVSLFPKSSNSTTQENTDNQKPWNATINTTKILNSSLHFQDNSLGKPLKTKVEAINTTIQNLTLTPNSKSPFEIDLVLNNRGKLNLDGDIILDPFKIETKYKLSALQLNFLQPYINEHLNLELKKATLYTNGSFVYQQKFNYFNLYSYVTLHNIELHHQLTNKELLQLKKLQIKALSLNKNNLNIKSIDISEPTFRANIYDDATTNFKEIVKIDPNKQSQEESTQPSTFQYNIGPVNVKNGYLYFSDATLPFFFATNIHDLNGAISQLSSDFSKPSIIELKGQIDDYGFAQIKGETTTSDWKNKTNIELYFKNLLIKNYTPYSGKFVGRKIDGGTLNLDLNYKIKESKLDAQNSIMLEKIKLGETVEHPDASSLPLELAIALLEDSNGVIDIELPISGDVNDPQFSIGHIVWKAVGKLIISIVASPFKLLGALIGVDQEQLNHVVFEPGKTELIAPAKESLDKVLSALEKRPNLSIVLQPVYANEIDMYALQKAVLDNYLQNELEEDIHDKDEVMDELEDLYEDTINEDQLEKIEQSFTKMVKHEKTGKEVEVFDQDGYIAKLQDDLVRIQVLEENALQNLALQRTQTILEYLTQKHVPTEKIVQKEEILEIESSDPKWADYKLDVQINKNEETIKEENPL